MRIAAIVEGHGEVAAIPVLLRRLAGERNVHVHVAPPIRVARGRIVRIDELQRAVKLATLRTQPGDGILVVLDADEDCPASLAPQLLGWARAASPRRQVHVVLAEREFEAWFLAATTSLVAAGKLLVGTAPPSNPEAIRDAKGWISEHSGRRYSPTIDQPAFAALFDLAAARSCRSFGKLERDVAAMLRAADPTGS